MLSSNLCKTWDLILNRTFLVTNIHEFHSFYIRVICAIRGEYISAKLIAGLICGRPIFRVIMIEEGMFERVLTTQMVGGYGVPAVA